VPEVRPELPDAAEAAAALAAFGYPGAGEGVPLATALRAFQRRWRPACCDGILDPVTMGLAGAVARLRCDRPAPT
jgi:N-acetylmuramoyl-L-alanine amidase